MDKLEKLGITTRRSDEYEGAVYSLALVYNICSNRLSEYLKRYSMSIGKFNILVVIRMRGGKAGISQVDISKHLIVTPSNMTKMIDKLEKDGFVKRNPAPEDRRINIIKATKKAEELLDQIWEGYLQELKNLMAGLNAQDRKVIASKMGVWLDSLIG